MTVSLDTVLCVLMARYFALCVGGSEGVRGQTRECYRPFCSPCSMNKNAQWRSMATIWFQQLPQQSPVIST